MVAYRGLALLLSPLTDGISEECDDLARSKMGLRHRRHVATGIETRQM